MTRDIRHTAIHSGMQYLELMHFPKTDVYQWVSWYNKPDAIYATVAIFRIKPATEPLQVRLAKRIKSF